MKFGALLLPNFKFQIPNSKFLLACLLLSGFPPVASAGDILRGGATSASGSQAAAARANAGAAAASLADAKAEDRLARTTQVINAMRQMQASARAASAAASVPNGLATGGLERLSGGTWTGASAPAQSGNTVTITQNQSQALLDWKTFNVGRNTTVNFDQSAGGTDSGKWIAFNKITDPSGKPSQILGSIKADGQVYLINQNGIIFGAGSQVNTRTLVASSLPINDNLISSGLLNNRDAQFLFSALSVPGGSDGTPAFNPPAPPSGTTGNILVERGASITTPQGTSGDGGRVMLVGPQVVNEGSISTPQGQTILAAGLQVGIRAHDSSDPSLRGLDIWVGAVDPTSYSAINNGDISAERGNIMMVGKQVQQNGVARSTTSVALNGRIDLIASYGAVSNPNFDNSGSTGGYGLPIFISQFTGVLTLGAGSVTQVVPNYADSSKIPGTKLPAISQINLLGQAIHVGKNSFVTATGGSITAKAGQWTYRDVGNNRTIFDSTGAVEAGLSTNFNGSTQIFLFDTGQIYLDAGAVVDASGTTNAWVPLEQNILSVQLRGSELADSPVQRTSPVRGQSLVVDLRATGNYGGRTWIGTPLGDLSGYANLVSRDVAQLTTQGGTVSMQAGSAVVVQSGATIDVSGGFLRNQGGTIQTSRLLRGANLIDIANATPGVKYDGIYNGATTTVSSAKWNVSKTFNIALCPTGGYTTGAYNQGVVGGAISLTAPTLVVSGKLMGQVVTGPRQLDSPPAQASLTLSFRGQTRIVLSTTDISIIDSSPYPPTVEFAKTSPDTLAPEFQLVGLAPVPITGSLAERVVLGADLYSNLGSGFGSVTVNNPDGDFRLPAGVNLAIPANGGLSVSAKNVTLDGKIVAPGGTISISAYNYSPFTYQYLKATGALSNVAAPAIVAGRGNITLGSAGSINVSGMIIDERPTATQPFDLARTLNAGSVTLEGFNVALATGSDIDASAGVKSNASASLSYGKAGSISLLAGKDPALSTSIGGRLVLDGTVEGYAIDKAPSFGGSLTLQSTLVQIGGNNTSMDTLLLDPAFFRRGGFTNYKIQGIGQRNTDGSYAPSVFVVPDTSINPIAWSLRQQRGPTLAFKPALRSNEGDRAPASITLSAIGSDDPFTTSYVEALGIVVVGERSLITTDAGASVSIAGDAVDLQGDIEAPGGTVTIKGGAKYRLPSSLSLIASFALPTVYLGPESNIDVSGKTVLQFDPYGRRKGTVFAGGSIYVSGNIIADQGATLTASGATGILDLDPTLRSGYQTTPSVTTGLTQQPWARRGIPTVIDSNGGRIELEGAQMLDSFATYRAPAGGPSAIGGTLAISSGSFLSASTYRTSADINLIVTQSGDPTFTPNPFAANVPGLFLKPTGLSAAFSVGATNRGIGHAAVSQFQDGGFSSLELGFKYYPNAAPIPYGGNVEFRGPVTITMPGSVKLAAGGIIMASSNVDISAPYISVGQKFTAPLNPKDTFYAFQTTDPNVSIPVYYPSPTYGTGSLKLEASLIDVGTLSLQGIGKATLRATNGDIRGSGTLSMVGDLTLEAGQIYPTTLANFTIVAYNPSGGKSTVSILQSGLRSTPLSAGGTLSIFASNIVQGGTLRAPFGSIVIGWDGTDYDLTDAGFTQPTDIVGGPTMTIPTAQRVMLGSGSVTSVSAIDGISGKPLTIPFGLSADGLSWTDPRGVNISISGFPQKGVTIGGLNVTTQAGSVIDVQGGGELLAFRWKPGTGGSMDLLNSSGGDWSASSTYTAGDLVTYAGKTYSARFRINPSDFSTATLPSPGNGSYWTLVPESYAIIPGLDTTYAPYAAFNTGSNNGDLGRNAGYVSSSLSVGDRIYLDGISGLQAGTYTLLPRLYAILPGAFLITPSANLPSPQAAMSGVTVADGSTYSTGYLVNDFARPASAPLRRNLYEVSPATTVSARSSYEVYNASSFILDAAKRFNATQIQARPADAGTVSIRGNNALRLDGNILGTAESGGRGATVDIATYADLYIVGGSGTAPDGATAVLNSDTISSWSVESVLIGGLRQKTTNGTQLDVRTTNLTLSNAGTQLSQAEVILASKGSLTVSPGSSIISQGTSTRTSDLSVSGDGTALAVTANSAFSFERTGETGSAVPSLKVGAGATISGSALVFDSTYSLTLDPSAGITATDFTLNAGQVSILFQPQTVLAGQVVPGQLVISGNLLNQLQSSSSLSLRSYRSIDIYGSGQFGSSSLNTLELRASGDASTPTYSLRGFNMNGGTATFESQSLILDNPTAATGLASPATPANGTLAFVADTATVGSNGFGIAGFARTSITAPSGVFASGNGYLFTTGALDITTSLIAGSAGTSTTISASGPLTVQKSSETPTIKAGLGAGLTFQGSSVTFNSRAYAPSGSLVLKATAPGGDVVIGGQLDVSGSSKTFYDLTRYADAGSITISASRGQVQLLSGSSVTVSADPNGGNAGSLSITSEGSFVSQGTLGGHAGTGGTSGTFLLDAGSLTSFSDLAVRLDAGEFKEARNLRIRTGDVTVSGTANTHKFTLSADGGSIIVTGFINASGDTGGEIDLAARENITVMPGADLSVAGKDFNSAGKGGSISLAAGTTQSDGSQSPTAILDIRAGSQLDLSVASFVPGNYTNVGSSAFYGKFSGTLDLRAPQRTNGGLLGVAINPLAGAIVGASSILVEGVKVFDLTGNGGQITGSRSDYSGIPSDTLETDTTQRQVYDNGVTFVGANGVAAPGYDAMVSGLLGAGDPQGLASKLVIVPSAVLINTTGNGDITVGDPASNWQSDWNLADFRFGPKSAPGVLTIRTPGNVVFWNTLSDGFTAVDPSDSASGHSSMWLAPLMTTSTALPVNTQSWTFRIIAGADLSAADVTKVLPIAGLSTDKGSIRLGKAISDFGTSTASSIGSTSLTNYQVIRTGTGDITLGAGRDVRLLNVFASIYTAGVGIADPQSIYNTNDFSVPAVTQSPLFHPSQPFLGRPQQIYSPQWSMAGGNIVINAQDTIGRYKFDGSTDTLDSSLQLPNNWLYRRGLVGTDGLFAVGGFDGNALTTVTDPSASTTWWIDFSNFFEGVGALGGGNVLLKAGQDILNVDAFAPTNARMPGLSGTTRLAPDSSKLLELGGGDVSVEAGRDISGGVYYVERGKGTLVAGGSITTNSARAAQPDGSSLIWLPTTLFAGKASFTVTAAKDVLIGPVVNTFWLPQGVQNKFWYKTYFSNYSSDSSLSVVSLGGAITFRMNVIDPQSISTASKAEGSESILTYWLNHISLYSSDTGYSQPWIRIAETNTTPFTTVASILPSSLYATSFQGDINVVGAISLFPSTNGTVEVAAEGSIAGLNPIGRDSSSTLTAYSTAAINLSDADPGLLPSSASPFGLRNSVAQKLNTTADNFLASSVDKFFQESGSYTGTDSGADIKLDRHSSSLLHLADPNPLRIYTDSGDISGFTLYSAKFARILAGQDLTDVALYIQNVSDSDVSVVSAGRDIIPFNENSPLRSLASSIAKGNIILDTVFTTTTYKSTKALPGDLQISGPGTLEVLAGQNIDLGNGEPLTDGRGSGISSIGNNRNPFLPFDGAQLIVMAGVKGDGGGAANGLAGSSLTFDQLLDSASFTETDAISAMSKFFEMLIASGNAYATTKSYDLGFAAIGDLFGSVSGSGDIFTRGRSIRTTSGGAITMAAPNGALTMASTISGNPLAPPGVVTEYGGTVSLLTDGNVDIGQGRIFTLRGGDLTIWSSQGNIAAGSAAKTVVTAPPTRVIIDTTSATIEPDLGGLATGGGIGVLASVVGVKPGNVTLIAPNGVVDAGDAGVRATGNITIAAVAVLNAGNISAGGTSSGVPTTPTVAAPNIGGLTSGASSSAAANSAANSVSNQARENAQSVEEAPSTITVEVLGYGGGDSDEG